MTIHIETLPAFPTHIHKISLCELLPLDAYADEMYRIKDEDLNFKNQPGDVTKSLKQGYRVDDYLHRNKVFNDYHRLLTDIMKNGLKEHYQHTADFNDSMLLFDTWGNILPKYGYNACHNHPGVEWASILYIKNGKSARTVFHDLRPNIANYGQWHSNIEHFGSEITVDGKDGDLLIFPSYLNHSVEQNLSDDDRLSISTNIKVINARKIKNA